MRVIGSDAERCRALVSGGERRVPVHHTSQTLPGTRQWSPPEVNCNVTTTEKQPRLEDTDCLGKTILR